MANPQLGIGGLYFLVLKSTLVHEYFLSYDADCEAPLWGNRLVRVQKNGATIAQFTFITDGKRIKSVMELISYPQR